MWGLGGFGSEVKVLRFAVPVWRSGFRIWGTIGAQGSVGCKGLHRHSATWVKYPTLLK